MKRRFRQINYLRADTIEDRIALAIAKRDYAAEEVWKEVAQLTGAPIRDAKINKRASQYEKVLNWYSRNAADSEWQHRAADEKTAKAKRSSKTKFTCPDCDQNAWAKAGAKLMCGNCEVPMLAEDDPDL